MKLKLKLAALSVALGLCLCACGEADPVPVMRADLLTQAAVASDRYAGVVVSENTVEITRESDYVIDEVYVKAGDQVRANEKLFSYDIDELNLTIDKQNLEMDKLTQQIKDYNTQIKNLESQIKKETDKEVKATLELTLRSAKADLTQAEYDKKTLQAEINYNKKIVTNAVVRSPIAGTVQSLDENSDPYITIQQTGAYQIKGNLNELSLNGGIMEGVSVTAYSRIDPEMTWTGVVSLVDYNSAGSNEYDSMYGSGGMSNSTVYPFYVTLDSTEGLLLGQHVYLQINAAVIDDGLLRVPESYILDAAYDEETGLITGAVWAVGEEGTLTLTPVVLGEFDLVTGAYVVTEGLSHDSYVADPAHPGCAEGAGVSLRDEDVYTGAEETEPLSSDPTGTSPSGSDSAAGDQTPASDVAMTPDGTDTEG